VGASEIDSVTSIRIIARPPGEAPETVRDAWVGVELPLPLGRRSQRRTFLTSGVLSGRRGWWPILRAAVLGRLDIHSGYAVNARQAVDILANTDPVAAAWWEDHAPVLLDGKRFFVFPEEVCEACE
jgi:hypothetical protein